MAENSEELSSNALVVISNEYTSTPIALTKSASSTINDNAPRILCNELIVNPHKSKSVEKLDELSSLEREIAKMHHVDDTNLDLDVSTSVRAENEKVQTQVSNTLTSNTAVNDKSNGKNSILRSCQDTNTENKLDAITSGETALEHEDLIAVLKGLDSNADETHNSGSGSILEGVTIEGEGEYQIMEVVDEDSSATEDTTKTIDGAGATAEQTIQSLNKTKTFGSTALTVQEERALALEQIEGLKNANRRRKQDIKPIKQIDAALDLVSALEADWSEHEEEISEIPKSQFKIKQSNNKNKISASIPCENKTANAPSLTSVVISSVMATVPSTPIPDNAKPGISSVNTNVSNDNSSNSDEVKPTKSSQAEDVIDTKTGDTPAISSQSENCLFRSCPTCKGKVISYNEFDITGSGDVFQWAAVKETYTDIKIKTQKLVSKMSKLSTTKPLTEIISDFEQSLTPFLEHQGRVIHQYTQMNMLKNKIKSNECLIHMDFSENYCLKYAEETQAFHFGGSRQQISLHTVVTYTKSNGASTCTPKSYCTLSESLAHGPSAIWCHLKPILDALPDKVQTVHFLSDGPATQYKNKTMFYILATKLKLMFPKLKKYTWNYLESGHGKEAADGVGAVCKRTADRYVGQGHDIADFNTLFDVIKENCPNITIFKIFERDIKEIEQNIDPAKAKQNVGTMKVHQVVGSIESYRIWLRSLSCFNCTTSCDHHHLGHLDFTSLYSSIDSPASSTDDGSFSLFEHNTQSQLKYNEVCSSDSDEDALQSSANVLQNSDKVLKKNIKTGFRRTRIIKRKIIWDPDAPETTFSYAKLVKTNSNSKTKTEQIPSSVKKETSCVNTATTKKIQRPTTPKTKKPTSDYNIEKTSLLKLEKNTSVLKNIIEKEVMKSEFKTEDVRSMDASNLEKKSSPIVTSPPKRRPQTPVLNSPGCGAGVKKKKITEVDRLMGDEGAVNMLNSLEKLEATVGSGEAKSTRPMMRSRAATICEKLPRKDTTPPIQITTTTTPTSANSQAIKGKRTPKSRASSSWDYVYKKKKQDFEDSLIIRRRSNSSYSSTTSLNRLSLDGTPASIANNNVSNTATKCNDSPSLPASTNENYLSKRPPSTSTHSKSLNNSKTRSTPTPPADKSFEFAKPESKKSQKRTKSPSATLTNDMKKAVPVASRRNARSPATTNEDKSKDVVKIPSTKSPITIKDRKDTAPSSTTISDVVVKKSSKVAQILFSTNKAKLSNTFTIQMLNKLVDILDKLASDPDCHVVVIGTNDAHFCQGIDLTDLTTIAEEKRKGYAVNLATSAKNYLKTLASYPKPIVGGVNGNIMNFGVIQLALFDVVIASDKTTFETPYCKMGQTPEGFCIWHNMNKIRGSFKTKLFWLCEKVQSTEAALAGLVNKLTSGNKVNDDALMTAKRIASLSTESYRVMKKTVINSHLDVIVNSLDEEFNAIITQWTSTECLENLKKYIGQN